MNIKRALGTAFVAWHAAVLLYLNLPAADPFPTAPQVAGLAVAHDLAVAQVRLQNAVSPLLEPVVHAYASVLDLHQGWSTFSPVPPQAANWLSVVGYDQNQNGTLLWTNLPDDPPHAVSHYGPLQKYIEHVQSPQQAPLQLSFLRPFAATYRARTGHDAAVVVLLQHTLPLGSSTVTTGYVYKWTP